MFDAQAITEELVRSAAAGGGVERDRLLRALGPQVRAMITVRLAPTPVQLAAVDDLAQQVLLAVSEGLARLRSTSIANLRAFTSRIAANKVADFLRHAETAKGARQASLDSSIHSISTTMSLKDLLPASGLSACSSASRAELIRQVLAELGRMDGRNREAIMLAFFDQLTVSQIAEQMGLTRAAASMLLLRAVKALRRNVTGSSKLGNVDVKHS